MKGTVLIALFSLVSIPAALGAPDVSAVFEPMELADSNLKILSDVPVATFSGTPAQMGKAQGVILGKASRSLFRFFIQPAAILSGGVDALKAEALKMEPFLPDRFREELKAAAEASEQDYAMLFTGNAFPDVYRGGGCSTLAAGPPATEEGRIYLARNLDFFSMGVLDKNGMIAVYKPEGYLKFASITWPGLSGVLSGMNEKGLCCAVMEVRSGIRRYDGMPSIFLFRLILEEAGTVEEALKILERERKVVSNNLMLVDASGASAVAEIGPGRFTFRRSTKGTLFATNDHREGVDTPPFCGRYLTMARLCKEHHGSIDKELLQSTLDEVNQGMITVQSMIFEPAALTVHLSMGKLPSSKGVYKTFQFGDAFSVRADEEAKKGDE